MTIQADSLICRVYLWSLDLLEKFSGANMDKRRRETNLCHFMRTILIVMPVIFLFQIVAWGSVIMAVLIVPLAWFGFSGYAQAIVSLAAGAGVVYGAIKLANKLEHRDKPPKSHTRQVIEAYIQAKHRKICPLVSIQGGDTYA